VQFEILPLNDEEVEVLFFENIITISPAEEETEKYSYDYYRLIIKNRENLQTAIETNIDAWVQIAKNKEVRESIHIPTYEDRVTLLEDTINFILGL